MLVRFSRSSGLNSFAKVNFHSASPRWTVMHSNIFRTFFCCHRINIFSFFLLLWYKRIGSRFSCASTCIELWMHLESSLETTQEARVALSYRLEHSYASLVLSKLPVCIHNSIDAAKPEPIPIYIYIYTH